MTLGMKWLNSYSWAPVVFICLNEIGFISFCYCYSVLVDIARVFLKSSDPDKNYINASFVDVSKMK